jgi:hypothetical protein
MMLTNFNRMIPPLLPASETSTNFRQFPRLPTSMFGLRLFPNFFQSLVRFVQRSEPPPPPHLTCRKNWENRRSNRSPNLREVRELRFTPRTSVLTGIDHHYNWYIMDDADQLQPFDPSITPCKRNFNKLRRPPTSMFGLRLSRVATVQ